MPVWPGQRRTLGVLLARFAFTSREQRWLLAVFASNVVGLEIDSILFLQIAFGSLDFIEGQIIEKLWTTVFAVVVLLALRRW